MPVIGAVLYIGMGLVQFAATLNGIDNWLGGTPWLIKAALALILAYIPVVGSAFGLYGATTVWGWTWWQAVLLFFGIPIAALIFTFVMTAADGLANRQARSGR